MDPNTKEFFVALGIQVSYLLGFCVFFFFFQLMY
jgi:hypothetical protein